MPSQNALCTQLDPIKAQRAASAARALQFAPGQRVRLIVPVGFHAYPGDLGTILHQDSIGSFAVQLDNARPHVWTTVDADEMEAL